MKYSWEQELSANLDWEDIKKAISEKYNLEVLGIAIAHNELVEACFIENPKIEENPSSDLDIWADIQHDVNEVHDKSLASYQEFFDQ